MYITRSYSPPFVDFSPLSLIPLPPPLLLILIVLQKARANTIAISQAVLNGQLPIDEWRRAHWLEIVAEAACIAAERGFGHYIR
ncbi:hypothetical protein BPOR_0722g00070 [Botrytis porri]|uniref:Uncharacterized protein n=1 Tax=Botrytis porri TaxID=87229 RepID=A0A4Z1KA70_9HELO|nr:hypothetical protein BPOR_0722g00070 [Botrytis porri]